MQIGAVDEPHREIQRPSNSPAPNTGSTFGWSIAAASRDSEMKRSRNPGSPARSGATSFSATVRPSASSTAS
jgi:hypothetical protein